MSIFFVVLISCLVSGYIFATSPCIKKQFDDGIGVVCDEQHQDKFVPLNKTDKGIINVYTSTKNGKRFEKMQVKFSQIKAMNDTDTNTWHVKIDRSKNYQKIIGFGTAFTDSAVLNVGNMTSKLQRQILEDMFSENGFEYSVVRTTIAGSDFSTRPYTYDDVEDDYELKHFSLVDEDIKFRIPQMKLANEIAKHKPVKYFGSPWSGPGWLKTSHSIYKNGTLKEGPGSKTWETYAKYLLKWLQSYRQHGVEFWGMTPQNEPMFGLQFSNITFNSMVFTPEMERDFIKTDLGPTLEKGGWTPDNFTIMIFDHNREYLPNYAVTVLNDTDAAKYSKGIAFHWYDNVPNFQKILDQTHEKLKDYFMLSTEACVGGIPRIGSWDDGEQYAADIIMDLKHWSAGWVDWNMVLNMKGGPSWINSSLGAPIIVNKDKNEYYKNPTLYAIGHFSKFLLPESQRIGMTINKLDENGFYTVAFKRPDNGIVVVVINNKNDTQILALDDEQIGQLKMQIEPKSFNSLIYYTN